MDGLNKKIFVAIFNLMLFWIFVDLMPGVSQTGNSAALFISSLLYGMMIAFLGDILKFFKFPSNFWAKLIIGGLLTIILLFILKSIHLLRIEAAVIGNIDLVLFTIPRLMKLKSDLAVILFSAFIVNICSIILAKLAKVES